MNYIVFDLEWNQSSTGKAAEVENLPFEIIEIGAVKLDENGETLQEFSRLIRPVVYREMNQITGELVHLQMKELEKEKAFPGGYP